MAIRTVTLGCRLNGAESDEMRDTAAGLGLRDLTIVNTCAVTADATRRSAAAVRRAARDRPGTPILVTGCAAEIEPARFATLPGVVGRLPNAAKTERDAFVALGLSTRAGPHDATDPEPRRTRAVVQVQNGCDHRCTFCIIPFGRGASRSISAEAAVTTIRSLVFGGAHEVVLSGVDLTSWGADLPERPRLGRLVKTILAAIPDLARLRLSSVDPSEIDADLLDAFATEPRLMPHLHLSLQAGDDLVLRRMKRRHRRQHAIDLCGTLRRLRPEIAFGADLIAGFPTEDEAMFARSLDLISECGLVYLHVFPYSPRPGTPAARMPQVAPAAASERAARLRAAGGAALARYLAGEVGTRRRVLTERGGLGRTEGFAPVRFGAPVAPGQVLEVSIAAQDGRELMAQPNAARADAMAAGGGASTRMGGFLG